MLTIDASVWISAMSTSESDSVGSRTFLDLVGSSQLTVVAPTLLVVEIAAAVARSRNDQALSIELADAVWTLPFIRWIPLDAELTGTALRLAAKCKLRGADAVYAAVASTYACRLISLDQEHLARLGDFVSVQTPTSAAAWLAEMKRPS